MSNIYEEHEKQNSDSNDTFVQDESFPPIIKSIQAQDYTLKIFITKGNIEGLDKVYEVNGIFRGWKMKQELVEEPIPMPIPTTSTAAVIVTFKFVKIFHLFLL